MGTTVLRLLQGHSIDVTNTNVDIKSYTNGAFLNLLYFITFQKILWNTQIRKITNFVFFFGHIFNFSCNSMKYSNSHNNKNHYEISCFFFIYFRFFIFLFFFLFDFADIYVENGLPFLATHNFLREQSWFLSLSQKPLVESFWHKNVRNQVIIRLVLKLKFFGVIYTR